MPDNLRDSSPPAGLRPTLVSGGGAGIGAAICRSIAARGGLPYIVDKADSTAFAAVVGGRSAQFDVTTTAGWDSFRDSVNAEFDGLDSVVLNVGLGTAPQPVDIFEITVAQYERALSVNCGGVFHGLRASVPLLAGAPSPHVLVMASVRGLWAAPLDPVYSMTKHALIGLVRSLAPSFERRGVRINALCPGPTLTPATSHLVDSDVYRAAPWQPADDVARAAFEIREGDMNGEIFTIIAGKLDRPLLVAPAY